MKHTKTITAVAIALALSGCTWLKSNQGKEATKEANRMANLTEQKFGIETGLADDRCVVNAHQFITTGKDGKKTLDTVGFIQACVWAKTNCNKTSVSVATTLCQDQADEIVKIGVEVFDTIIEVK